MVFRFIGNGTVYAFAFIGVHVDFRLHCIPLTPSHEPIKIATITRATPNAHGGGANARAVVALGTASCREELRILP